MIKQLEERLAAIQKIAFAHYEAGVELSSHSKGREREVFVSEFLSKVFPNGYRFSSGDIVDLVGRTAGQVDLVLEFPFEPSFPMPWGEERLILSHSVIAALEIKSSIDQWDEVVKKSKSISLLERTLEWDMTQGDIDGSKLDITNINIISKIPFICVVYKGPKKIETLKGKIDDCDPSYKPTAVLTLDQGYRRIGGHPIVPLSMKK